MIYQIKLDKLIVTTQKDSVPKIKNGLKTIEPLKIMCSFHKTEAKNTSQKKVFNLTMTPEVMFVSAGNCSGVMTRTSIRNPFQGPLAAARRGRISLFQSTQ